MDDLFAIPDFLKRQKKRGRPRKTHEPDYEEETRKKYEEWDLIKQKKYGIYSKTMEWMVSNETKYTR